MTSPVLAKVYTPGGHSFAMRTTPGRVLKFVGGYAEVTEQKDMPHVLRMPEAKVIIRAEWQEWLPQWLAQCDFRAPAKALYWIEDAGDPAAGLVDLATV